MKRILIIGGGAAGMIAGIAASNDKTEVTILEKNEKVGKKLFITGKGRCNVTNACSKDALFKNINTNPKFMFSAFDSFDNEQTISFFEKLGLSLKIERGNRVFPVSDKSSDVIKALKEELIRKGVGIHLNTEVTDIRTSEENIKVFAIENGRKAVYICDSLIIATGGLSYPSTGSTGDGYRFAIRLGHTVTETFPSLVALETSDDLCRNCQGLTLKNVTLMLSDEKQKTVYKEMGELLFTHFGISGPLVLSASSYVAEALKKGKRIPSFILDLKPGISEPELDERIQKDFIKEFNRLFKNALDMLLPQKLIPEIIKLSGIDPEKKVNEITREERLSLVSLLKKLPLNVTSLRGYEEAVITKGGVNIKEINPKTMQSKLDDRVFFAGEVMDLDAMTGGFNLQIAWSTGFVAGISASENI